GKARTRLYGAGDAVTALAFAPDYRTLAAGNSAGSIRLFDLFEGKEWRSLDGHRGEVDSLQFSADGKGLLSTSRDTTALVWDLSRLKQNRAVRYSDHLPRLAFDALWADLAGEDTTKAFRVILHLSTVNESVPLIKARLLELNRSFAQRQAQIRKAVT